MARWLVLLLLLSAGAARASVVDRIAVVVDGHVITEGEVAEFQLSQRSVSGGAALSSAAALDAVIEKTVAEREAERLGLKPSEEEVEQAVAEIRARNNLGAEEFRRALASQGMEYASYLKEVRGQLLRVKVTSQVLRGSLSVSDEALREYYLKHVAQYCESPAVKLQHLEVGGSAERAKAEALRAEVLAGEPLAAAAASAGSDRPRDLGYVPVADLSAELRAALGDLPAGQVSPVLELQGSCHLFYVEDRQEGRIRSFEEVREELRSHYFEYKEDELFRTWVESLVEKARIEHKIEG